MIERTEWSTWASANKNILWDKIACQSSSLDSQQVPENGYTKGEKGTPVTWRVTPWFLDDFSDRGNTVANQSCTTKKILRDAILVSILNSQQSRRTVTSKLKRILVTSRMPSRSLDDWCDRGNVVSHQSKEYIFSSEIRYQFKSELSSPSSCGERSKTSWQVKTDFFMILNLILDLFFEKKLENGP